MSEFSDKIKFPLYLLPASMARTERLYREDGSKSKSEFIEKAVNFYCGFLESDKYEDYFPKVIISTFQGLLDSLENRMASLQFKTAVELSMLLHVTAATNEIDEATLSRLRGMCVDEVKRLHGNVSFEDAVRFQKG